MPNMWQYESIVLKKANTEKPVPPDPQDVKDSLNPYGKLGYQVIHIQTRDDGTLFVILARDTGRPLDEGEDKSEDWLVDVVTGHQQTGFGGA